MFQMGFQKEGGLSYIRNTISKFFFSSFIGKVCSLMFPCTKNFLFLDIPVKAFQLFGEDSGKKTKHGATFSKLKVLQPVFYFPFQINVWNRLHRNKFFYGHRCCFNDSLGH